MARPEEKVDLGVDELLAQFIRAFKGVLSILERLHGKGAIGRVKPIVMKLLESVDP